MNELSTAGSELRYAAEATAGTRPTTGYTAIPDVKSVGGINPSPTGLEVSNLAALEWMSYIPGLKDPGGAISVVANLKSDFMTAWGNLVTAYNTANSANPPKSVWFEIAVPGLSQGFFFAGIPSPLGMDALEVNVPLDITTYITPNKITGFAAKST